MEFIYQKESNLDKENDFTIEISDKNNVEKEKFIGRDEYVSSSLNLKLKYENIAKWTDYKEIETLSNLINATKEKFIKHRHNDCGKITK